MSKLRGTCSSNLTRFQLNRQKLVFFKRGGWKPFQRKQFGYLCIQHGLVFSKNVFLNFGNIFVVGALQKNPFSHSENGKWVFCPMKRKTFFVNIVRASKMHVCV